MSFIKKYFGDLFLTSRFYLGMIACIAIFICSFFLPALSIIPLIILQAYLLLIIIDYSFLFFTNKKPSAKRLLPERLSNGDENKVVISIVNPFSFPVKMEIIDELPEQFQVRNFKKTARLKSKE